MRVIRQFSAVILAICLCAMFMLPVFSARDATGQLMPWEARAAAQWLREALPQPAPGEELAVLALLRSGQVNPADPYAADYAEALLARAEEGEAAKQEPAQTARQLLVLAAAGLSADSVRLSAGLPDAVTLKAAGPDGMRLALLAFGPAGLPPPEGLDAPALAEALAAAQNQDGGFGADGVSDAISTAQALQALAFYRQQPAAESSVALARAWLRASRAEYGGYDLDGSPSARATAEAVIALCCLSEDGLEGVDDPAGALAVFQNEDGSFSADPDSPPDTELTALGLLAIVSHARLERGMAPVFRMSDVPQKGGGEADAEPPGPADAEPAAAPPAGGMPPLPTWAVPIILVGTVALIVVLAAVLGGAGRDLRRRRTGPRRADKLQNEGDESPGAGDAPAEPAPRSEASVLALPLDYIGAEGGEEAAAPPPAADEPRTAASPPYYDEG